MIPGNTFAWITTHARTNFYKDLQISAIFICIYIAGCFITDRWGIFARGCLPQKKIACPSIGNLHVGRCNDWLNVSLSTNWKRPSMRLRWLTFEGGHACGVARLHSLLHQMQMRNYSWGSANRPKDSHLPLFWHPYKECKLLFLTSNKVYYTGFEGKKRDVFMLEAFWCYKALQAIDWSQLLNYR